MAKISELLERVEVRLALAQGLDVQIHAEERLIEIIRHKYNVLFDMYWWMDYTTFSQFTLDGVNGFVTTDLTDIIRRFIDIHSVFLNKDGYPLPILSRGANPANVRRVCITPHADKSKVFRVLPMTTSGPLQVWYRQAVPASAWTDGAYDTDVNMDDEMLILGSCFDFLVDDGTNQQAAEKFKAMFDSRFHQLTALEHHTSLSKHDLAHSGVPDTWYEDGP